jgi:cytochrome c oxidase assembly protein subunit 15
MSQQGWEQEFAAYKTSPEFQKINSTFGITEFKRIFWLEYIHRVLGRIVGLALVVPFIFFSVRRMLPKRLFWRMAFACVLVASQGTVGWIMVASGLVDAPRVSPIKLGLHLSLAFALYATLVWTRWQIAPTPRPAFSRPAFWLRALLGVTVIQIILGALVAGLDAGYSYNTFPLMDGAWIPSDLHLLQPWWLNHLENVRTVQFQHRMGAYLLVGLTVYALLRYYPQATLAQRRALHWLAACTTLQFTLGVATLLSVMNIALASAHQLGALLLLTVLLWIIWLFPQNRGLN